MNVIVKEDTNGCKIIFTHLQCIKGWIVDPYSVKKLPRIKTKIEYTGLIPVYSFFLQRKLHMIRRRDYGTR